jgi:crotonobetaine/carnitine-CoA ligase
MPRLIGLDVVELNFPHILAERARDDRDRLFLRYLPDDRRFTFGEVDLLSTRFAHGLLKAGIRPGDHVAIMMDNSPETIIAMFAIAKLRAVVVPINTASRGHLMQYYLTQSDAMALIIDTHLLARLAEIETRIRIVIINGVDLEDSSKNGITDWRSFDSVLAAGIPAPLHIDVGCYDLAMIAYTSGTTGPSKGCLLSQAAALSFGFSNVEAHGYRSSDTFYTCLPFFHVNALGAVYSALTTGGTVVVANRFSATKFWHDIEKSGATVTNLLGSMAHFLWGQPASVVDRNHALRLVSISPVPSFAKEFEQRFGIRVISSYGISDFALATAYTAIDSEDKLGSTGRARRGIEIEIVDEHDFAASAGSIGEIVLRCKIPWRAGAGYYKMPEATVDAFKNGWFHTGDRGYIDSQGYLYFVDRKKDAIRRRGENISAFEVEQIIALHPAVQEATVYPLTSDASEDEVAASVILKAGANLTEHELAAYCTSSMAGYMVPRYIAFVSDFPRTPNQKIEKYKLRAQAEQNRNEMWDRDAHLRR